MMMNVNVRAYGTVHNIPLKRQRVAARPVTSASTKEFRKGFTVAASMALLAVFGLSQVISWQAGKTAETIAELRMERSVLSAQNDDLVQRRDKVMSKRHIRAVAGARLELYAPGKNQVYRM